MKNTINIQEERISSLESKINEINQYGRRNNIEVAGIPESVSNLEDTVIKIGEAMNVKINSDDIEACHRLPRSNKSSNSNPKNTIVRFVNRKKAEQFKRNSGKLRDPGIALALNFDSTIYINDNLCPAYKFYWSKAKELYKKKSIAKFSVRDGTVCIKIQESSPWLKIKHMKDFLNVFPDILVPYESE